MFHGTSPFSKLQKLLFYLLNSIALYFIFVVGKVCKSVKELLLLAQEPNQNKPLPSCVFFAWSGTPGEGVSSFPILIAVLKKATFIVLQLWKD